MPRYKDEASNKLHQAFRHQAQRMGLSAREFEAATDWIDSVRPGTSPEQLQRDFADFTSRRGWSEGHVQQMLSVYAGVSAFGADRYLPPSDAGSDARTIDRAKAMLRDNPNEYWKDVNLQQSYFEALERQTGRENDAAAAAPPPQPTQADIDTIGAAEAMMRSDPGRYYNSDMSDRYRQAIGNVVGDTSPSTPDAPTGPAPAGGDFA
jgi:hypothetical protein